MELNNIIFPAPKPSYNTDYDNLVWINLDKDKRKDKIFTR